MKQKKGVKKLLCLLSLVHSSRTKIEMNLADYIAAKGYIGARIAAGIVSFNLLLA